MITIISGERHSGKSSLFLHLFQSAEMGIGVFSQKLIDSNRQIRGYNLHLLPNGTEFPFIRQRNENHLYLPDSYLLQGHFLFLKSAFKCSADYILNQPENTSIWIDEVGKLELQGLGHAMLLKQLIGKNRVLTITIREIYIPEFLSTFSVTDYRLVKVPTNTVSY